MKSPKIFQKIKEKISGKLSGLSYRKFLLLIAPILVLAFVLLMILLPDDQPKQTTKKQPAKPKVQTVKVVTAGRDIPARTILREDMLVTVEAPSNLLPEGYVTDAKQAVNLPTAMPIQKGDILTNKKFYSDIRMAGFPGKIPDDCRAVSIGISDITGVAGFAKPGDYVDIMAVSGKRGAKSMSGKILLQNVLLIGINKSAKVEQHNTTAPAAKSDTKKDSNGDTKTEDSGDKKDKDKKEAQEPGSTASAQAMATATVAVTPEDALKLAVASQTGTLYLALRPVVPKEPIVSAEEYIQEGSSQNDHEENAAEADRDDNTRHYNRTYEERVAAYTPPSESPNASVPLPPTSAEGASAAKNEVTVEVIRGTKSETSRVRDIE